MRAPSGRLVPGGPTVGDGSGRLVALRSDDPAWMDLVAAAPDATVFHLPAWAQVIADTYRYRATVLAELDAVGRVAAGVPAVRVRRLSGPAWVSLPFSDHCPPLARDGASLQRLAADLGPWSKREGVALEVRGELPAGEAWKPEAIGVRQVLALNGGVESLWKGVRERDRRYIRVAERRVRVRFSRSLEDLDVFYRLQVRTRRRQGVPVQPRRFVDAVGEHVIKAGRGVLAVAETPAGHPLSAAVLLAWNGTVILKWLASDASHWDLRANRILVWESIRWASDAGHRAYDFGRSDTGHGGLQQFKAGFGAEALPLTYTVTGGGSSKARALPVHRWAGGALGLLIRHSPAGVCRALGSLLYRYAA
ncbi:MAG TPA: GNAT family N-acetyltransferase [Candidatus Dormibacteraeota bacterium]|nr:GNAT family N-acetyltransferase [Candidatus Dormibacteraeota bacterium]